MIPVAITTKISTSDPAIPGLSAGKSNFDNHSGKAGMGKELSVKITLIAGRRPIPASCGTVLFQPDS
jgi:hypothetical protein